MNSRERHKVADDAEQAHRDAFRDATLERCRQPLPRPLEKKMHHMDELTKMCKVCRMSVLQIAFSGKGCVE